MAERIERIRGMMARNEYRTYVTCEELSKEWGLAFNSVEQMACEAARSFKLNADGREALRARLSVALEALAAQAAADRNSMTGMADPRAAADILEKLAKFSGINLDENADTDNAPRRIEVVLVSEPEPSADATHRPDEVSGAKQGV
jgi:hypothetical protein